MRRKLSAMNYIRNNKRRAAVLIVSLALYLLIVYLTQFILSAGTESFKKILSEDTKKMQMVQLPKSAYGSGWEKRDDGYYYYSDVLGKGETTLPLLTACQPLKSAPLNGYTLCVDIISQIVQSEIDNGTLPFANP